MVWRGFSVLPHDRDAIRGRRLMNLILIIDEDARSLEQIQEALSGKRFRIITTGSWKKGMEFARAGLPDLLILDMGRTGSECLRFIEELKQDEITHHISIIVTLRTASKPFIIAARKLGVLDFLLKPFDTDRIFYKLEKAMVAIQSGKKEKTTEVDSGRFRIVTIGNRFFVFWKARVTGEDCQSLEEQIEKLPDRKGLSVIFDIRAVPELAGESLEIFQKFIRKLSDLRIHVVGGQNYGVLLENGMDELARLFLSTEELNEYFSFLGKR